jgi:NADPH2:quinone reductase
MHAIQITAHGGPEVLSFVELPDPAPGPDEAVVQVAAAGVNYLDTYHRSGLYQVDLPMILGNEGAGVVTAVGPDVADVAVGDRVAWGASGRSYATHAAVPVRALAPVPEGVELDVAAAVMLQGMTAHYLVHDTFELRPGQRCLIHAAAGGVGLLLVQLAKAAGAEVFATVGSPAKAELAAAAGADHTILYRDVDFVAAIEELAGPRPIDVVYDGVGRATFDGGLRVLRRRGTMVTFGNASGPVEPISPLVLSTNGSLYLTRPTLFDHVVTRDEMLGRATDLFAAISAGTLDVRIGARVPLAEAAEAHRMLEGRQTTGKVLLVP